MAQTITLSDDQIERLRAGGGIAQIVIVVCLGCDTEPIAVLGTQSLQVTKTSAVQVAIELGWANQSAMGGWYCPTCKDHET